MPRAPLNLNEKWWRAQDRHHSPASCACPAVSCHHACCTMKNISDPITGPSISSVVIVAKEQMHSGFETLRQASCWVRKDTLGDRCFCLDPRLASLRSQGLGPRRLSVQASRQSQYHLSCVVILAGDRERAPGRDLRLGCRLEP